MRIRDVTVDAVEVENEMLAMDFRRDPAVECPHCRRRYDFNKRHEAATKAVRLRKWWDWLKNPNSHLSPSAEAGKDNG